MSLTRRLDEARKAFEKNDPDASKYAHSARQAAAAAREEHSSTGSQYLGNVIYGGLDGIVTTFAVVSGVMGAQLSPGIVMILGLANLFGDGFSMAVGAFLAAKSDHEFFERERAREAWEVEHYPEGERLELREIYLKQGYPPEDAEQMVNIKSKDMKRWVDAMMVEELNLLPSDRKPILEGLSTFGAFLVAGSVPLLSYLIDLIFNVDFDPQTSFYMSLGFSGLALFLLGAAKVLVTQRNPIRSGLEMLAVGGLAAGVAYGVGALLKGLGVG